MGIPMAMQIPAAATCQVALTTVPELSSLLDLPGCGRVASQFNPNVDYIAPHWAELLKVVEASVECLTDSIALAITENYGDRVADF